MIRGIIRSLVLASVLAAPAGAQDTRLASRLSAPLLARVDEEIVLAREQGLPVEPLIQKALEGASKGADDGRVARAVASLRTRLRRASEALGSGASEAELVAAAGALFGGVLPSTLRELKSTDETGSLVMELIVLADLIRRGVDEGTASEVVLSLSAAGASDRSLSIFRERVDSDIRLGAPPSPAALTRARAFIRSGGTSPTGSVPGGLGGP